MDTTTAHPREWKTHKLNTADNDYPSKIAFAYINIF